MIDKNSARLRRSRQTRLKIREIGAVRLTVHRTNVHIYAQITSPGGDKVLASASSVEKELHIGLKYYAGRPVIERLERVSKPGLRVYKGRDDIPRILNGLGVAILSTSRGVMTDRKARADGVGGEILCIVA